MSAPDVALRWFSVYTGSRFSAAPGPPGATQRGGDIAAPRKDTSVSQRSSDDADAARPGPGAGKPSSMEPDGFDVIVQKLKLLEFGLYGLHQYGRSAPLDVEDLAPFYRLAEEIQADVLALQARLAPPSQTQPAA